MTIRIPQASRGPATAADPREGGFVLAAAAFGLLVVILLVTGGFFIAQQEFQVGTANENAAEAFYLTEQSLAEFLGARWDFQTFGSLLAWAPTTLVDTIGSAELTVEITRTGERTYFVDGSAKTVNRGLYSGATRRVGMVMKMFSPDLEPPAALTTRGTTQLTGTAEIQGGDNYPPDWGSTLCSPYGVNDKPGVLSNDTSIVSLESGASDFYGNPPVDEDLAIADSTFTQFDEVSWTELVAMAEKTVGSGGSFVITQMQPTLHADGTCNKFDPLNWGDPENPGASCGGYFPTVYINAAGGEVRLESNGVGQGVLLVDGDLTLLGRFLWHGIIIVQGNFGTEGAGPRVYGGVLASNPDLDLQEIVGGSEIVNSTCASTRAVLYNSALTRLRPLTARSWVDLTGAEN
jgi:hypothetical protein